MATASNILVEFAEIASCSICTEEFTDPRMLACRHTFCLRCLQMYRNQQVSGNIVACPLCRQEFTIPVGGLANLDKNLDIERLLETSKRVENKLKEGAFTCQKHSGKAFVLYCQQCSQLICPSCIIDDHSQHKFEEIESATVGLVNQLQSRFGCSISDSIGKLRSNIDRVSKAHSAVTAKINSIENEVNVHCENLIELLEEDRDSVLEQLSSFPTVFKAVKSDMDCLAGKLESFVKLWPDVGKGCRRPMEVIPLCSELLSLPIEELMKENASKVCYTFEPNLRLFKLRDKSVNTVGHIERSGPLGQKLENDIPKEKVIDVPVVNSETTGASGEDSTKLMSMFGEPGVSDEQLEAGKIQDNCASWCSCDYCEPMVEATERRCCATWRPILNRCEAASVACVTQLPGFSVNCLNRHVVQVAFYEEHSSPQSPLSKSIHEIYRDLACVRFRRWIYRVPRGQVNNGVPACALDCIRRAFPPEDGADFTYPR